jgi:hypothetical protein
MAGCLFLTRTSHSFAFADVVVLLTDGSHITADRIEQNTSSGDFVAVTERPGIKLERKFHPAEVQSVLDGGAGFDGGTGKGTKALAESSQQKQTMTRTLTGGEVYQRESFHNSRAQFASAQSASQ